MCGQDTDTVCKRCTKSCRRYEQLVGNCAGDNADDPYQAESANPACLDPTQHCTTFLVPDPATLWHLGQKHNTLLAGMLLQAHGINGEHGDGKTIVYTNIDLAWDKNSKRFTNEHEETTYMVYQQEGYKSDKWRWVAGHESDGEPNQQHRRRP